MNTTNFATRAAITDLRGPTGATQAETTPGVLHDLTGRRARSLTIAGRAIGALFLLWLVTLVLGGVGLFPGGAVPFAGIVQPSVGPPPFKHAARASRPGGALTGGTASPAAISPAAPNSSAGSGGLPLPLHKLSPAHPGKPIKSGTTLLIPTKTTGKGLHGGNATGTHVPPGSLTAPGRTAPHGSSGSGRGLSKGSSGSAKPRSSGASPGHRAKPPGYLR
jgi:hypothetical protein